MGRWLNKIKKSLVTSLPKPTQPGSVGFDSASARHISSLESIEFAKTKYSDIPPSPAKLQLTCKCGYMPPFCTCCKSLTKTGHITCNRCKHFTPDNIGDRLEIGNCYLGIEKTQSAYGYMPLYHYTDKHCGSFISTRRRVTHEDDY